jgi:hypothetical protein
MDDLDGEASGDVDLNSEDSDAELSDASEGVDPDDFSEEEGAGQGTAEGTDSEDGGSEEGSEEESGGEEGEERDDEERHRRMLEAVTGGGRENKAKGKRGQVVLSEAVPESEFSLNPGSAGGAQGGLFCSLGFLGFE